MTRTRSELVDFRGHLAQIVDSETIRHGRVTRHVETLTYGVHRFLWEHGQWVALLHHLH